ncbi:PREDICTED: uncharacterized protein LOC107350143 [Acropora digitifera]|uniref:uncharacterized protein LOC107350143 n=1 Tax=Acropora digitifera TaxID=70779 RepID=UPI00077ACC57|nr:PREDICTED: uncharacterized protein LOC107350143 [Acropora digitifera]
MSGTVMPSGKGSKDLQSQRTFVEQLRRELNMQRVKLSQCANDLIQYCEKQAPTKEVYLFHWGPQPMRSHSASHSLNRAGSYNAMEVLPKPVLLVLYLLLGNECTAVTKRWLPNTNFNNSANWDKGRVPCVGDNVQLNQEGRPLAVSLRTVHTLKSLSLPVEGEVIFFDGAELHFNERQEKDPSKVCKGQYFLGSIKYSHQSCFFGAVWSGTK